MPLSKIEQSSVNSGVAGTGPAFSAYQSVAQTLSSNTTTKITFTTEEFDTNSNFASSVFTPTVAGYYQVTTSISISAIQTPIFIYFYKNGSLFKCGAQINSSSSGAQGTALIYCNGSTDYIEVYANINAGQALATGASVTYFQAVLVRAA